MPAARHIKLSEEEDRELQRIENNRGMNEKVRLRAKVVRLSHCGMSVEAIASYSARHSTSVLRDFNRWESRGLGGLADGIGSGRPGPIGEEERNLLREKLSEDRSWTASQLAEVVNEQFKLSVNRETMRVCLHVMGYSWQRHRYVPVKKPDAQGLATKQAEFERLKKEPSTARSPSNTLTK